MSVDTIYEYVRQTPTSISEELYTDVGTSFTLGTNKRAFLASGFAIRRTSGGTPLTLGVDYELDEKDVFYSAPAYENEDVYTQINILNSTYETGNLYVTYSAVLTYATKAAIVAVGKIIETVTADATVTMPVGETVTNVNAATATITIPSGAPLGSRITVRKISSSAGTVTIARSSTDVFTRASLTSVTLTSDGDFWVLEKVSATRWELVDGVETEVSGVKSSIRKSGGEQIETGYISPASNNNAGSSYSFVKPFSSAPTVVCCPGDMVSGGSTGSYACETKSPTTTTVLVKVLQIASGTVADAVSVPIITIASGRWYT